jgi:hypothetical protein
MAVVFIVQVAVDAFVAQEKEPEGAAEHETTEGLAAVPVAAHFVVVSSVGVVMEVVKLGAVVPAGPPVPDDEPPRSVATPVPSPEIPVDIGNPVAFVSVPDAGVPRAGVTIVQEVTRQKFPLPLVFPVASDGVTALTVNADTLALAAPA